MIAVINGPKPLAKQISFKCKYKFYSKKCDSNQKWNNESLESYYMYL